MKMIFKNEYFSHPEKLLRVHLKNVGKNGIKIIDSKRLNLSLINKEQLNNLYYIISLFHDFGKYGIDFQKKLFNEKDYDLEKSKHSKISSLVCYLVLKEYCNLHKLDPIFSHIGAFLIKRHHGNLDNSKEWFEINKENNEEILLMEQFEEIIRIPEVQEFYNLELNKYSINFKLFEKKIFQNLIDMNPISFKREFKSSQNGSKFELFLITELLFSVLVDSDKKDAAGFDFNNSVKEISQDCVQKYLLNEKQKNPEKFNPELEINKVKNELFENCVFNENLKKENKIYSITAPTGSGKTLTSFAVALKLKSIIENKSNYRIHYILPFTTIIDQNYEVFRDVLSDEFNEDNENDYIMKHHYLTVENLKKQDESNKKYDFKSYFDELLFVKSWDSALVVSSYVQFLETIIGGKNSFMNKFHNIINSIVILDEVQCISSKYWDILREIFLELSNKFGVYFIFLTATQPLIFNRFENKFESTELANPERFFNELCFDRVNINIVNEEKNIDDFFKEFIKTENLKNRYLFVLNTKKSSLELYNKINTLKKENVKFKGYEIIYLSTNLTPDDRKKKLDKIVGKKNQEKNKRYIVVTTQLIEAGVDISSDVCYRDFAPIDSIIQSAGRVNRFGELNEKGEFFVIRLMNENKKLFSNFVYSEEPVLKWTENVLKKIKIKSSIDFYNLSEQFFKETLREDKKTKILSESLEKSINELNFDHKFKFIEDKPTHAIFILNDDSKILIDKYKEIYSKKNNYQDFWKWKGKLKKIRKEFQRFIIEIWPKDFVKKSVYLKNNFKELGEEFFYLDVKEYPDLYHFDTGFNLDYEQDNFI